MPFHQVFVSCALLPLFKGIAPFFAKPPRDSGPSKAVSSPTCPVLHSNQPDTNWKWWELWMAPQKIVAMSS